MPRASTWNGSVDHLPRRFFHNLSPRILICWVSGSAGCNPIRHQAARDDTRIMTSMNMNTLSKNTFHRARRAALRLNAREQATTALPAFLLVLLSMVGTPRLAEAAAGRIITGTDGGVGGHVKAFTSRSLS